MLKTTLLTFLSLTIFASLALANDSEGEAAAVALRWRSVSPSFGFRQVGWAQWNIPLLYSGVWFRSLQAQKDGSILDADVIWGALLVRNGYCPITWLSYFGADANISKHDPSNGWDFSDFSDVNIAAGFIASTYLRLDERNSTGDVVRTVKFSDITFNYNPTESQSISNVTEGIYAFVLDSLFPLDVHVKITYIMTTEAGILDIQDGVPMVPKSIESIITISSWSYQSPENTLSLITAAATRQGAWSSNQFSAGSGAEKVYFYLASRARIQGTMASVILRPRVVYDNILPEIDPKVWRMLLRRYSKPQIQVTEIQFPAGASLIEYDPTTGSGDSYYDEVEEGMKIVLIITITVCVVLVVAVIIGGLGFFYKKRGYSLIK